MNIEMALISNSYILDLNHVKLSLRIFFLLAVQWRALFLSKTHTPKSRKFDVLPNFTCVNGSLLVPWSAIYFLFTVYPISYPVLGNIIVESIVPSITIAMGQGINLLFKFWTILAVRLTIHI